MSLSTGQTLTQYEILGPLGAGGMGEVYRAKDTRLEREVAIKVLPAELAGDPDRFLRFEREAKTLASLNHPNVAGIHGVDQDGDVYFLALELVPGEDLATRLSRKALPVDEAIDVGRQIAEGLEAAHEAGVVHRDLKPANVRVTPEGVVKILDFGLAKPIRPKAGREGTSTSESDSFLMTQDGVVLGTPTYMSPEQARGKPVDRRTDIWALGCVLYECLTGTRAFSGESFPDLVAAIVHAEPDWDCLPPLPERVRELLRRTLAKDPRERLRDAGEARVQLALARREATELGDAGSRAESATGRRASGVGLPAAVLLGGAALAAGYGLRFLTEKDAEGPVVEQASAEASLAVVLEVTDEVVNDLELSPDGSRVAWTQPSGVFLRELDSFDVVAIDNEELGLEHPYRLAWSPDGSQLAFTTPKSLWRVDADGRHLTLVTRDELGADTHAQLDWSRDGQLVYSDSTSLELFGRSFLVDKTTPLFSAEEETTLHFDGVHILPDDSPLVVRHRSGVATPDTLSLWRDGVLGDVLQLPGWNLSGPTFAGGTLVFERRDTIPKSIWGVTLDLESGRTIGDPRMVVEDGQHVTIGGDILAYVVADAPTGMQPVWIDLDGEMEILPDFERAEILIPTLSYDGASAMVSYTGIGGTVWAHDVVTGQRRSLGSMDPGLMILSHLPDGRLLAINPLSGRGSETVAIAPSGTTELVCEGFVMGASRDGRLAVAMRKVEDDGSAVIEAVDLEGNQAPIDLGVRTKFAPGPTFASISPDNRWALVPCSQGERAVLLVLSTRGDSPPMTVAAAGCRSAWFNEAGDVIYYWTIPEGQAGFFTNAMELWRAPWQGAPDPRVGPAENLIRLDAPVLITGFDFERGRFLASWQRMDGRNRILARTGWTSRED